ncbi:hypothetical protein JQ631_03195 [Bradyrhizobium manausense]|uniref:hypothetical protein n=1 Tax=Bradyrhizobium manausense TaxID=989370 RepID=UPI001BA5C99D|nr:hypothetical protein [Bradyrhizobium manausense]MBR0788060.1 hypothetical protein [Bradyrhizobium manausense]
MARFLFLARFLGRVSWQGFFAGFLGRAFWDDAHQPVRARSCDMTVGYALATMDKTAPKIKYAPGQA